MIIDAHFQYDTAKKLNLIKDWLISFVKILTIKIAILMIKCWSPSFTIIKFVFNANIFSPIAQNTNCTVLYFQYIRVTTKTDPAVIWEVLIEEWELSLPDLVISISGGLKMFQMVPRLKERFKRGLIETATTTGKEQHLWWYGSMVVLFLFLRVKTVDFKQIAYT